MNKRYAIPASQIKGLVPQMGGCFVTDRVMVDGLKIGYMYREAPDRPEDSGWRFFSGEETQTYLDDINHTGVYAVNTAANADPEIIPYLNTPAPCEFEKQPGGGYRRTDQPKSGAVAAAAAWIGSKLGLKSAEEPAPGPTMRADGLRPDFPITEGRYQLSNHWAVTLPAAFNRRMESGSLILWRPGVTIWTAVFSNDRNESQAQRMAELRSAVTADALDMESLAGANTTGFAYRVNETREGAAIRALHVFVIGATGHIQMSVYSDYEGDADMVKQIAGSVEETRRT